MNWLKAITKSGRQELAREALHEYADHGKLAGYATDGIALLLDAGTAKLSEEKCARLAEGLRKLAEAFRVTAKAIDPSGDCGVSVSVSEKIDICELANDGIGAVITQDCIDSVIDTIVAKIP